jgi:HK97 family phage portal protein
MPNIIDRIKSWLPTFAKRAITGWESWVTAPTLSGVVVNEDTATTFAAVYAAINVLASDTGGVPLNVVRKDDKGGRVVDTTMPIHDLISSTGSPNEELSTIGIRQAMMWHLLTKGNAFAEIERDAYHDPVAIHLIDPDRVEVKRSSDRQLYYQVAGERYFPRDIIHVSAIGRDGLIGRSPIQQCREEIGLGMAVVKFGAARFGNGISESGAITIPGELDELETIAFRAGINREHQGVYNANKFLLLQGGATFTPTSISSEDAQFLESRKFSVEEICRIFRIPPTKLMNFDRATFGNIEETNLDYYLSSLSPWLKRIESEFNRKLLTRSQRKVWTIEHDETFPLRGRIKDQAEVDKIYRDMGVLSTNEIRSRRGWGRVEGGDVRFVPLNMAPLAEVAKASLDQLKGASGASGEPTPAGSTAPTRAVEVFRLEATKPVEETKPVEALGPVDDQVGAEKPEPGIVGPVRSVVRDAARRMARREAKALRACARKRDLHSQIDALEAFYRDEVDTLVDAYSPALHAYSAALRKSIDPRPIAEAIVSSSREQIRACVEGPSTSAALATLADRWEAEKADAILSDLERTHENAN